jgi:small nuclear ribonucleoprotein (snRNP)-like protein
VLRQIILRDGKNLVGVLRSFDQYMNLVLENTCERVIAEGKFSDFELGFLIIRGDDIVVLAEIDDSKEEHVSTVSRLAAGIKMWQDACVDSCFAVTGNAVTKSVERDDFRGGARYGERQAGMGFRGE